MLKQLSEIITRYPEGVSPSQLEKVMSVSRATINRKLRDAVNKGLVEPVGNGAARVYRDADPLRAIKLYFEKPHTERNFARYREELLEQEPSIDTTSLSIMRNFPALEKKEMLRFLIEFSCASSLLEGGTYSLLDTQALIEYGEKAQDKPLSDAFLILNHKNAFEYLHDHLSINSIFEVHARLTDDHGLPALHDALHFLDKEHQGVAREYDDITIAMSTYSPPFRPGAGYVRRMLERILDISSSIENPIQNAFYLLTRIPYLQPFADGNKRTSRAICNVPLIKAGMPPISFVDFGKKDYIISMLAFYELGDVRMAAHCFSKAYLRSCERLGL